LIFVENNISIKISSFGPTRRRREKKKKGNRKEKIKRKATEPIGPCSWAQCRQAVSLTQPPPSRKEMERKNGPTS